MEELLNEFRNEKNIPPFVPDEKLLGYLNESHTFFRSLVYDCDYDKELVYRGLLKERAYYSYCNQKDAFYGNYQTEIQTWQLNREVL